MSEHKLLVYSEKSSRRLSYVLEVIFHRISVTEFELTHDADEFKESKSPKLNYSEKLFEDAVNLMPDKLLFQDSFSTVIPSEGEHKGLPTIFAVDTNYDLPYDPLAAIFFLITRYEEQQSDKRDEHQRFPYKESWSMSTGTVKKAMAHHWAFQLIECLKIKFPDWNYERPEYKMELTFDIDNAYAFRFKGWWRTIAALLKDLPRPKNLARRVRILLKKEKDPFDTYKYIIEKGEKNNLPMHFFFLCGRYGKYDRNIVLNEMTFYRIMKKWSKKVNIGIHPSYASHKSLDRLVAEHGFIEMATERHALESRTHYIKFELPLTFRRLLKVGVERDFSMGYPEQAGFRSGMAVPYPFFDLKQNIQTKLEWHPFQFMEATYLYYENGGLEKAEEELKTVIEECRSVGGVFYPVWHNESLCDEGKYKGYLQLFEEMIELGKV